MKIEIRQNAMIFLLILSVVAMLENRNMTNNVKVTKSDWKKA